MTTPEQPQTHEPASEAEHVGNRQTSFGTIEANELWRLQEAGATIQDLRRLFKPNMSKRNLNAALDVMATLVSGSLISEYRLGHYHGVQSSQDETDAKEHERFEAEG